MEQLRLEMEARELSAANIISPGARSRGPGSGGSRVKGATLERCSVQLRDTAVFSSAERQLTCSRSAHGGRGAVPINSQPSVCVVCESASCMCWRAFVCVCVCSRARLCACVSVRARVCACVRVRVCMRARRCGRVRALELPARNTGTNTKDADATLLCSFQLRTDAADVATSPACTRLGATGSPGPGRGTRRPRGGARGRRGGARGRRRPSAASPGSRASWTARSPTPTDHC